MTSEAKALKFACLACMFLGIGVTVASIVMLFQDGATTGEGLSCGVGVAAVICGAQCSRLVNVPSNAGQVRTLSLVLFVLAALVAGLSFGLKLGTIVETCLCAGVAVIALVQTFFAHRLVKMLERV